MFLKEPQYGHKINANEEKIKRRKEEEKKSKKKEKPTGFTLIWHRLEDKIKNKNKNKN